MDIVADGNDNTMEEEPVTREVVPRRIVTVTSSASSDRMEAPVIQELKPANVQVFCGSEFRLEATYSGNPEPEVMWLKGRGELQTGGHSVLCIIMCRTKHSLYILNPCAAKLATSIFRHLKLTTDLTQIPASYGEKSVGPLLMKT